MDNLLGFCCECGGWIPPEEGQLRVGGNGKLEAVCQSCEQPSSPSPQSPKIDSRVSSGRAEVISGLTSEPGGPNRGNFREPAETGK